MSYIIITTNPLGYTNYFGLFETRNEAYLFGKDHFFEFGVVELKSKDVLTNAKDPIAIIDNEANKPPKTLFRESMEHLNSLLEKEIKRYD